MLVVAAGEVGFLGGVREGEEDRGGREAHASDMVLLGGRRMCVVRRVFRGVEQGVRLGERNRHTEKGVLESVPRCLPCVPMDVVALGLSARFVPAHPAWDKAKREAGSPKVF